MKHVLVIFVLSFIAFYNVSGKGVNYTPKPLQKELQKQWNSSTTNLIEIADLSDQLIKEGKFFELIKDTLLQGYVFIGRIYSCRAGGCEARSNETSFTGYEYFDAYIIYDKNRTVKSVKVFNYQATHGHEITSKGWLKQFIDFTGEYRLKVGKDIDSISGATISVNAITDEVNYLTEMLKFYK